MYASPKLSKPTLDLDHKQPIAIYVVRLRENAQFLESGGHCNWANKSGRKALLTLLSTHLFLHLPCSQKGSFSCNLFIQLCVCTLFYIEFETISLGFLRKRLVGGIVSGLNVNNYQEIFLLCRRVLLLNCILSCSSKAIGANFGLLLKILDSRSLSRYNIFLLAWMVIRLVQFKFAPCAVCLICVACHLSTVAWW